MTVSVELEILDVLGLSDSVDLVTNGSKILLHDVLSNNTQMRVAKAFHPI